MRRKTQALFFAPLLLLLLLHFIDASAQEKCFAYETTKVKLMGTISKKTFPGPPNYESISRGDEPETYWVLHLARPLCTVASADDDAESNVTDMQMILTAKQYARFRKFIGGKGMMAVTGKLSHAITGHHHTPVLIEVLSIGKAPRMVF
jgi:hypothetical protein